MMPSISTTSISSSNTLRKKSLRSRCNNRSPRSFKGKTKKPTVRHEEDRRLLFTSVQDTIIKPRLREDCGAAVYENSLYLFGGIEGCGGRSNKMEAFNLTSHAWSNIVMSGDVPSPRSGHSVTSVGKNLWLYAGEGDSNSNGSNVRDVYDDLYCHNMTNHVWKRMHVSPEPSTDGSMVFLPTPRRDHTATAYCAEKKEGDEVTKEYIFMFGGMGPDRVFGNDVFFNDLQVTSFKNDNEKHYLLK